MILVGPLLLGCVHPAAPLASADAEPGVRVIALDETAFAALLVNPSTHRLVVNIWATWCGPCREEMGLLQAAAAEHPEVEFALVSVDSPRDAADVVEFLTDKGMNLPAYRLDTEEPSAVLDRTVESWPDIIPVTLVLGPGGAVHHRFDGVVEADALRAVLADPLH